MTDDLAAPKPRCRNHLWQRPREWWGTDGDMWTCTSCGRVRDEARARIGRNNRRAGNDAERGIAKAYGGARTGQFGGPDDVVVGELLCIQSKAGVSWFPERLWNELQKLPRTSGRIPTLVISDRPGPGRRTRRLSIRTTEDDVALLDTTHRAVLGEGSQG